MIGKFLPLLTLTFVLYRIAQRGKQEEMKMELITNERYKHWSVEELSEDDEEEQEECYQKRMCCYDIDEMMSDDLCGDTSDEEMKWFLS